MMNKSISTPGGDISLDNEAIARIDDNSSGAMKRVRVHFKNGHSLSIIRGEFSFGGDEGLFEIMPSDEDFFDEEDSGDSVCGYLTPQRVEHYINKIGGINPTNPTR